MNDDDVVYTRQRDTVIKAIKDYGTDHVSGVTVGNEYMFQAVGGGASKDKATTFLLTKLADFRTTLTALALPKTIPIGTADVTDYFGPEIMVGSDYAMENIHPWFAHVSVADAGAWTLNAFTTTNAVSADPVPRICCHFARC